MMLLFQGGFDVGGCKRDLRYGRVKIKPDGLCRRKCGRPQEREETPNKRGNAGEGHVFLWLFQSSSRDRQLHGEFPVISLSSLKKPRLRSLLVVQLTGTD